MNLTSISSVSIYASCHPNLSQNNYRNNTHTYRL
jgi:hypothetical protein